MTRISKDYLLALAEYFNEDRRIQFKCMGSDGTHYTERQKEYTFELIDEFGIRATARILRIQRRTLQRWCRKHYIWIKRCPFWVYKCAEERRKR